MKHSLALALVFVLSFGIVEPVESAMIYSFNGTGEDIYNHPDVSFPTRAPVPYGTSLVFSTGTNLYEKLFELPLVPAGPVAPTDLLVASISMNLTRLTADYDFNIGITDGANGVALYGGDNFSGGAGAREFVDAGTTIVYALDRTLFVGAGFPPVGYPLDINFTMSLYDTFTNVTGGFLAGYGTVDTAPLDRSAGLSFVFAGDDVHEAYQVNSLNIQVDRTVIPEPSALVVLALGVAGLVVRRRRREMRDER